MAERRAQQTGRAGRSEIFSLPFGAGEICRFENSGKHVNHQISKTGAFCLASAVEKFSEAAASFLCWKNDG
jgi:hypothetical protein